MFENEQGSMYGWRMYDDQHNRLGDAKTFGLVISGLF